MPDVHLNLGSVTAEAPKWDEMWALLTSAADTMCFSMKGPYVFGSEGQARGLQRGLSNRSPSRACHSALKVFTWRGV